MSETRPDLRLPLTLLIIVVLGLAWSGIGPYDRLTWVLEVRAGADRGAVAGLDGAQLPADAARLRADRRARADPDVWRALHLRAHAARRLDARSLRLQPQPLRPHRPPDAGIRSGHRRARAAAAHLAAAPRQVAVRAGHAQHPRHQRRVTSSPSGGPQSRAATRRARSSARRATSGTRSGTCSWQAAAPSRRRSCWRGSTTASCSRWTRRTCGTSSTAEALAPVGRSPGRFRLLSARNRRFCAVLRDHGPKTSNGSHFSSPWSAVTTPER